MGRPFLARAVAGRRAGPRLVDAGWQDQLRGGGEPRGNGMVVTQQALAAAGGWPAGALTGDLELSTALLGAGVPIAWSGDASSRRRVRPRWPPCPAAASVGGGFGPAIPRPGAEGARGSSGAGGRPAGASRVAGQLALPPLVLGERAEGSLAAASARRQFSSVPMSASAASWRGPPSRTSRSLRLAENAWCACRRRRVFDALARCIPIGLVHIAVGPTTVTFARTTDRLTPRDGDSRDTKRRDNGFSTETQRRVCCRARPKVSHRGSMSASIQDMPVNTNQASVAEQAEETIRSPGPGALVPYQLGTDKRRFVAPDAGVVVSGTYGLSRWPSAIRSASTTRRHRSPHLSSRAVLAIRSLPSTRRAVAPCRPLPRSGLRTFRVGHEASCRWPFHAQDASARQPATYAHSCPAWRRHVRLLPRTRWWRTGSPPAGTTRSMHNGRLPRDRRSASRSGISIPPRSRKWRSRSTSKPTASRRRSRRSDPRVRERGSSI